MIIQPKIRGFICTTAHPQGCYKAVEEQIDYVKSKDRFEGAKNVLVIGASTGYGLASRIVATYGCGAKTIGVFFEKMAEENRTASPGWYNSAAFETIARRDGYYARSINGDAFSKEVKQRTADLIRRDLKQVDLVVYSLASPRRTHPETGVAHNSTLKTLGQPFVSKTVDAFRSEVKEVTITPATETEIANTIAVMGGEDWEMWMDFLAEQQLLAEGVKTVAYSYIGPKLTYPIYKDGTIGQAKAHLKKTGDKLNEKLKSSYHGSAVVSVNKAVVTQASSAIPVVPLYISILFKVMKAKGTHEGVIEQIYRLFKDFLYAPQLLTDAEGYIRIDDYEMDDDVQKQVEQLWPQVTSETIDQLTDVAGYRSDFNRLFGFEIAGVDYNADVDPIVMIPSLSEEKVNQ